MRAFLLAAGEGKRLRPLTLTIPKCLVPINATPLLEIWLDLLERHDVTEVLINLHHLHKKVEGFLENYKGEIKVTLSYEPSLLGSAGTVLANRQFVESEQEFFVLYGDNLTNINLSKMMDFHRGHHCILTMGLFETETPEACGIAEMDGEGRIVDFEEKPRNPRSNLANAGIFVASHGLFNAIPSQERADFGFDVLQGLVGEMYGYIIPEYLIDIGSAENYERAQREWLSIGHR